MEIQSKQKLVWIINPYTVPISKRTRQIVLSQRLIEAGYKVVIVCGSQIHGTDKYLLKKNEKYKFIEFDGEQFLIVNTMIYEGNGAKRVLASIQFQHAVWNLRKSLPVPDVIVSNFAGLFGNVYLKYKRKYSTRIIYDILDLWPETFVDLGYIKKGSILSKVLYSMEHRSYRDSDGVIFSFEGGRDYIIERGWDKASGGNVDINKVGYINNGVDLETVDKNRVELILDDYDLDTDKFKVAYLGSIRRANDLEIIVETAKVLHDRKEESIVFLIYGDGDQRATLEMKAEEYGLTNIIFKGRLPVEYAPNMLSRCNINIFNFMNVPITRFGLSPNKLFMYFASGKPVLETLMPNYDLVSGRNCGIVTDNTPEAIADGIIKFSKMPKEEYELYCQNCRAVAEEFDYKNLVKVLIDQIEGKYEEA
ncbi:glycosyltransferase family 4 protein [Clostridium algidicarnis]|uniref:glycosyltransferase family 4 protein n=1 Tax=Clostridium algidicarnis TaxID=37659 RepID=UPI001627187C|nr:glycosyltransferase family 4 protein [Clostridium algidicarnis]MBB6698256.1 glycosyltransferase family 4 protein [Clostridium algidicarnis]